MHEQITVRDLCQALLKANGTGIARAVRVPSAITSFARLHVLSDSMRQVVFDEARLGHLRLFEPSHASDEAGEVICCNASLEVLHVQGTFMLQLSLLELFGHIVAPRVLQVQLYHLRLHEVLASEAGCCSAAETRRTQARCLWGGGGQVHPTVAGVKLQQLRTSEFQRAEIANERNSKHNP